MDYVQAGAVFLTMIFSIVINSFVIFLVGLVQILQKIAFFPTLQIIIAHLVYSCTILPVRFVTSVFREWGLISDLVIFNCFLLRLVLTIDSHFCLLFILPPVAWMESGHMQLGIGMEHQYDIMESNFKLYALMFQSLKCVL